MLGWIDYIWFVGEAFHRREGAPGDGEALLMGCWYMGAFLPLLTFSHRVVNGWGFYRSMSIGTWAGGCWR